jgi:hypothetical protein
MKIEGVIEPKPEFFVATDRGEIQTQPDDELSVIVAVFALDLGDRSKGCRIGRYGLN